MSIRPHRNAQHSEKHMMDSECEIWPPTQEEILYVLKSKIMFWEFLVVF